MVLLIIMYLTLFILVGISEEISDDALDLRKLGLVTEVKNQGPCAAGWSFAIIGVIEGQFAKKTGQLTDFSAQQLVDCLDGCRGCAYCDVTKAMDVLVDLGGVESEQDYPYTDRRQCCHYNPVASKVQLNDYYIYKKISENSIKKLLKEHGPVYVAIDGDGLQGYTGGVLRNCAYKRTNHAILIIGYGSEEGVDYWLIKNSWGTSWGIKGYAKIERGINACGLLNRGVVTAKIKV